MSVASRYQSGLCILLSAALGDGVCAQPEAGGSVSASEVCRWIEERLPDSVYYELLLEGRRPGNLARHLVVFDLASDASLASGSSVFVRRPQRAYRAKVQGDRLVVLEDLPPEAKPPIAGMDLPVLYAKWVVDHPEYIAGVEPREQGGYRVTSLHPRELGGTPEFEWLTEFDAEGAVLSARSPATPPGKRPQELRYAPEYPRNWMVLSDEYFSWNWRVVRRVVREAAPDGAFAEARLVGLVREADTDVESWSTQKVNEALAADGLDPVELDPQWQRAIDQAKHGPRSKAAAFVVAGVVLILLALVGWWRGRP